MKQAISSGAANGRDTDLLMPPWSKYAGQRIDTTSRRSLAIVDRLEGALAIDGILRVTVADYFYHAGQFWRAVIPLDAIQEVRGQSFNFSRIRTRRGQHGPEILYGKHGLPRRTIPVLNHVQSRFVLHPSQPITLFPLGGAIDGPPLHQVNDFVYSLEAVGPAGVGFDLRNGLVGNLVSAHRFLSTREMVFERIVVENKWVTESPPLPLPVPTLRRLLVESLLRSHRAGMSEAYHLFCICGTNNCTSGPLQVLDRVVSYQGPRKLAAALYRLPLSPRFYLRIRGLDADPASRKLVRDEFADFIHDPATQARKREHIRQRRDARREVAG